MARHPRIEGCMFCGDFPCSCEPVAKKAPTRKKASSSKSSDQKSASSPTADGQPTTTSLSQESSSVSTPTESFPAVLSDDPIKAAMKAAAAQTSQSQSDTDQTELLGSKLRWVDKDELRARIAEREEELAPAINALEPILHPNEKRIHKDILDRPDMRAERWRAKHGR